MATSSLPETSPPPASNHIERRSRIEPLWLVEQKAIQEAIALCDGNVNRAAGLLEVAPSTLYRKMQSWKAKGLA